MQPDDNMMKFFKDRNDGQITSLELLAIALGSCHVAHVFHASCLVCCAAISTFADDFRGRNVMMWSDNTGAEHITNKGAQQERS